MSKTDTTLKEIVHELPEDLKKEIDNIDKNDKPYIQMIIPVQLVGATSNYFYNAYKYNYICQIIFNPVMNQSMVLYNKK